MGYSIAMTSVSFDVLRHLADGQFHSGTALAHALDVSRGTVWNAVQELGAGGLDVYRVRGRGYKLAQPVSLLERNIVERHAAEYAKRCVLEIVDTASSTNTLLMQQAAAGAPSGTVLAAEWQRSGRGRMGRPWHGSIGGGLTFSVLWRFTQGAGALAGLSLACGLAIVRALNLLGAHDVRLKWPNDVLWNARKLAGILIEMQGDALGPSAVVIGIGLNVRLDNAVRSRIDQPAGDLEQACGRTIERSIPLGTIVSQLFAILERFAEHGFAPMREEWQRHHAHQGKTVHLKLPSGRVERGVARGVADDGALLFESGNALRRLHSGEISLREARSRASAQSKAHERSRA
jgi:BirA family biotin operon repressor/biotin-[acetyl-CoA-carboxylase] ligase